MSGNRPPCHPLLRNRCLGVQDALPRTTLFCPCGRVDICCRVALSAALDCLLYLVGTDCHFGSRKDHVLVAHEPVCDLQGAFSTHRNVFVGGKRQRSDPAHHCHLPREQIGGSVVLTGRHCCPEFAFELQNFVLARRGCLPWSMAAATDKRMVIRKVPRLRGNIHAAWLGER